MILDDAHVQTGLATLLEEPHLGELWRLDAIPSEDLVHEVQRGGPDGHAGLCRGSRSHCANGRCSGRIPKKTGATPADNRCITVYNVMSRIAQKHQMK